MRELGECRARARGDYPDILQVGHLEVNIPEGLQYQTPSYIASWLARNSFNCVRLTYSIDLALDPNVSVQTSFANAATKTGASGLNGLYSTAASKNPWLASSTTLGAFTQVIQALAAQNILVILDNQMSSAGWCCSQTDGNGWFNDGTATTADSQYFNVANWMAGLKAMATYAKAYPNVVGMSVRNELRPTSSGTAIQQDWATHVKAAAAAIYQANPNLLVMIGGISYDLDLSWLYSTPLDRSSFANRTVWEVHWCKCGNLVSMTERSTLVADSWSYSSTSCSSLETSVGDNAGYLLASNKAYTGPLWVRVGDSAISYSYV
jgi:endoglucanase